jgi:Flp pilus assembly protein TadG
MPFRGRLAAREDAGFVGGFEGLLFGFLVFVVGTLMVAAAWGIVDTKTAVEVAARQAARTYVEAPDAAEAGAQAQEAAYAALSGYGRDPSKAKVVLVQGSFVRCVRISIAVSYPAPLFILPIVGRVGTGIPVRAVHSELVDPYRSGLAGSAECT